MSFSFADVANRLIRFQTTAAIFAAGAITINEAFAAAIIAVVRHAIKFAACGINDRLKRRCWLSGP